MQTKLCSRCKLDKPCDLFYADKSKASGLSSQCKDCNKLAAKESIARDPERAKVRSKLYYETNKEQILADAIQKYNEDEEYRLQKIKGNKAWKEDHREELRQDSVAYRKQNPTAHLVYYHNHKPRISAQRKVRRQLQTDETRAKANQQRLNRIEQDISVKLACRLRSRMSSIVRGKLKGGSAVRDLGCTTEALKLHLECQFQDDMNWENYGRNEGQWSVDHIMPLSRFNLEDRQHFLLANHYLNLRPLWHVENMAKSNKIPHELSRIN